MDDYSYALAALGGVTMVAAWVESLFSVAVRLTNRLLVNDRRAQDVMFDLIEENSENSEGMVDRNRRLHASKGYAYRLTFGAVLFFLLILRFIFGIPSPIGLVFVLLVGSAVGYLAAEYGMRQVKARSTRQLEFYLPIVVERIVMAVQAGHDVLGALKVLLDLDERLLAQSSSAASDESIDPVTSLLQRVYKLSEAGVGLEKALHDVATTVECAAIRHAFIHLAQAHKEGGELVMPLRELSDSTQLYYQESIEEEIAKLPVKATLPLLCTFAGLIVFFLTAPMIQVMEITAKAMPK